MARSRRGDGQQGLSLTPEGCRGHQVLISLTRSCHHLSSEYLLCVLRARFPGATELDLDSPSPGRCEMPAGNSAHTATTADRGPESRDASAWFTAVSRGPAPSRCSGSGCGMSDCHSLGG